MSARDKAKHAAYQRAWRAANKEKVAVANAKWYAANKEKFAAYNRERYLANRETVKAQSIKWKRDNPEKAAAQSKKWFAKNRDRILANPRRNHARWKRGGIDLDSVPAKPETCDACGLPGALVMDHCHGRVIFRGWLCQGCNKALGFTKDNPATLRALADYLERKNDSRRRTAFH